jgi:hypothetical protein
MEVNLLNKWLTLGANLGVLLGIIFLSLQISQANRIATGTMEKDIRERFSDISDLIIENPEFAVTWAKLQSPNPELSTVEQQQVLNHARSYWLFFASAEGAYESALLSEDTLGIYLGIFPNILEVNPGFVPFFKRFVEGRSTRMAQLANDAFLQMGIE